MSVNGKGGQKAPTHSSAPAPFESVDQSNALTLAVPSALIETIAHRAAEILAGQVAIAVATSPWLDTKGAAEYLSCSPARIHDLVALGKLTPRRDGRRLLFARRDLDAYLEASA